MWLMIIVVYPNWAAEAGAKLVFRIMMMTQNRNAVVENLSSAARLGYIVKAVVSTALAYLLIRLQDDWRAGVNIRSSFWPFLSYMQ